VTGDDALDVQSEECVETLLPAGEVAVGEEGVKVGKKDVASEEEFLSRDENNQTAGGVGGAGWRRITRSPPRSISSLSPKANVGNAISVPAISSAVRP
jgi:hypothetical protein